MFDITLIHPKLVHFPIAFLLAALVFDVWGMIKKDSFYHRVGWLNAWVRHRWYSFHSVFLATPA